MPSIRNALRCLTRWAAALLLATPAIPVSVVNAAEAARAFIAFLKGPETASVIEKFGYGTK